jgi:hypothetical protein
MLIPTNEEIAERAQEIACLPNAGSDFYNWQRAKRELDGEREWADLLQRERRANQGPELDREMLLPPHEEIAERAYVLARTSTTGTQRHNWLRAEYELATERLVTAQHAESIARAENPDYARRELEASLGVRRAYSSKRAFLEVFGEGIDAQSSRLLSDSFGR